jgi:hypothetical protein
MILPGPAFRFVRWLFWIAVEGGASFSLYRTAKLQLLSSRALAWPPLCGHRAPYSPLFSRSTIFDWFSVSERGDSLYDHAKSSRGQRRTTFGSY